MAIQSRAPAILLTRPAAQSARFATALLARLPGIRIVTSPLLAPRFLSPELPDRQWTALILTSETAVETARRITADGMALPRRAFCVGDRTAATALVAGFDAISAEGDAEALLTLILSRKPQGPLLHLRGRESRGDIANRLNSAGIETFEAIAYAQEPQPLTSEAIALLTNPDPVIAPLFSPRSAQVLARECSRIGVRAPLIVVALSPAIAAAAEALSGQPVIAARPDAEAMGDAISSLPGFGRNP